MTFVFAQTTVAAHTLVLAREENSFSSGILMGRMFDNRNKRSEIIGTLRN